MALKEWLVKDSGIVTKNFVKNTNIVQLIENELVLSLEIKICVKGNYE